MKDRTLKHLRIEPPGASIEDHPQHRSYADKPGPTHHQKQTKRPAPVNVKFAGERSAQRHRGEDQDQDGVQAYTDVLNNVAKDTTTNPDQIKSANADDKSGEHVHSPVPAMKGRHARSDLRNKLKRSADSDNDGHEKMHGQNEI